MTHTKDAMLISKVIVIEPPSPEVNHLHHSLYDAYQSVLNSSLLRELLLE